MNACVCCSLTTYFLTHIKLPVNTLSRRLLRVVSSIWECDITWGREVGDMLASVFGLHIHKYYFSLTQLSRPRDSCCMPAPFFLYPFPVWLLSVKPTSAKEECIKKKESLHISVFNISSELNKGTLAYNRLHYNNFSW